MSSVHSALILFLGQIPIDHVVLAQDIEDPQILSQIQSWFANFVASGQLWALCIGFIIGFAFRSLTAS
ncbi:hypothetical protein PN462_16060 [Spirulina sp. CS-785/01]|uniref:hypothetical protein n=1 Tax=Spirulina sp. CS-785/01 TaxID=3021716 RepID=UPI00232ABF39|nr:hypothetical protein [Spirulina sp. CS-785/01]MDB9314627.1 hypothetical protein [Spirulina sp. CS-785/01]